MHLCISTTEITLTVRNSLKNMRGQGAVGQRSIYYAILRKMDLLYTSTVLYNNAHARNLFMHKPFCTLRKLAMFLIIKKKGQIKRHGLT